MSDFDPTTWVVWTNNQFGTVLVYFFLESYEAAVVPFQTFADVLGEALLSDTCNARIAPCIFLNMPFSPAAVGCTF